MVSVHVAPVQSPPQPANVAAPCGRAVNVTLWLNPKVAMHVAGQLMRAGFAVTVPVPLPAGVTTSVCGPAENVAYTVRAEVSVTLQVLPLDVSQPDQLVDDPEAGIPVSLTVVLSLYVSVQVPGH